MTWADEQVMRECYLRPFEICAKEASYEEKYIADSKGTVATRTTKACTGIMSSFNYIGTEWTGGRKSLLTDVLRDEWGFGGMVITDFNLYGYMDKMAPLATTSARLTSKTQRTGAPALRCEYLCGNKRLKGRFWCQPSMSGSKRSWGR